MKVDPSGRPAEQLHRPEQPGPVPLLGGRARRASACTPARAATATRPTAPTWTTSELLPSLFELKAGNFYVALAGEKDRGRVLRIIRQYLKPDQRVFVGVIAPIDPRIETPEEVRDLVAGGGRLHPGRASSAPRTTAVSRRSATTRRPPATRRSRRSARASLGTALAARRPRSAIVHGRPGRATPSLRRDPEREEHPGWPVSVPSRSCFARRRLSSARRELAHSWRCCARRSRPPGTASW